VRWIHAHDQKVSRAGGVRKPRSQWSRADGTLAGGLLPKALGLLTCMVVLTLATSWFLGTRMPMYNLPWARDALWASSSSMLRTAGVIVSAA
jgi:hypothetical protein